MSRVPWWAIVLGGFVAGSVALGAREALDGSWLAAAVFAVMSVAGALVLLVTHS